LSGGLSYEKRRSTKRKSGGALPSKLLELGVSERLTKLEKLTRKSDKDLTTLEKAEKKTILRLEKNRRAAAVSRERKKRYIRSLEERSKVMAKHLDAMEKENSRLRALLRQRSGGVSIPPQLPLLDISSLTDMPLEQMTPRRIIKKERNEVGTSSLEKLCVSDVRSPLSGLNADETQDMPPLCTPNDRKKSKRLRLM